MIIPITNFSWDVRLVSGQTEPVVQGWYSDKFNKKVPNTVSIYSAKGVESVRFGWLMVPYGSRKPEVEIESAHFEGGRMELEFRLNGKMTKVDIPFSKDQPRVRHR